MSVRNSRREFFGRAAGALATVSLFQKRAMGRSAADKPALLGGSPVHRLRVTEAEPYGADIALVNEVGVDGFGNDRKAERGRRARGGFR